METFFVFLDAHGGGRAGEAGKLLICILVFCKHPGSSSMCSSSGHTFLMESPHNHGEATIRACFYREGNGAAWGRGRRCSKSHSKTPRDSSSLLSTWHRVPQQWLHASLKELIQILENCRWQTSPPRPLPKNGAGAWGLCCDKLWEPAPHQVVQARRKSAGEKMRDHRREEEWRDPEGAFRADLAYF